LQDVAGPDPGFAVAAFIPPVARAASGADESDVLQGWVATELERPLFRQDRRPPKGADESLASSEPMNDPAGGADKRKQVRRRGRPAKSDRLETEFVEWWKPGWRDRSR
jgi:hypothetical protein